MKNGEINNKKLHWKSILFGILGYIISYSLSDYYSEGDQIYYRKFYEEVLNFNFNDWYNKYEFYTNLTGGREPGYFLLISLVAYIFEKDLIFSIFNGLMLGTSAYILLKRGSSILIIIMLSVNLYIVVLFFSAERLKLGVLIFELAFLFHGRLKWFVLGSSILFHFQMIIPACCYILWKKFQYKKNFLEVLILLTATASAFYGLFVFFPDLLIYITEKKSTYEEAGWGGIFATIKPIILIAICILYVPERLRFFVAVAPLILASYFFGSQRITIFAFSVMLLVMVRIRHGFNLPVLMTSVYFGANGLAFVLEFIAKGYSGEG